MATLLQTANKQRSELDAHDAENLRRIAEAYALMYDHLSGDVDALTLAIDNLDSPTVAEIKALPQYKTLLRKATQELDRFTSFLEVVVGTAGLSALTLGLSHSAELVNSVTSGFSGLDTASTRALLTYLQRGGPLYERLTLLTGSTVDNVVKAIIDGVGSGYNPRKIAGLIQDAFGGGLTDALRNVRTVQIKSYQDAARANYMASDGIVTGWIWYAELDDACCLSCVSMHGTEHPLTESLDDHYNGRCAALPLIPEFGNPVTQSGQAWFDAQPESVQRSMMGPGKLEAYKAGKFEFSALSNRQDHSIYGTMRTETSLKDLVPE